MDTMTYTAMDVMMGGIAVVAGLLVVATGIFSIVATLWDDLLERDVLEKVEEPLVDLAA